MSEAEAIEKLRELERDWPETLWIFASDGHLNVMRTGPEGERMTRGGPRSPGIDQDYLAEVIKIPSDGGGW